MSENQSNRQTPLSSPSFKINQPSLPSDGDIVIEDVTEQITVEPIVSDLEREVSKVGNKMTNDDREAVDLSVPVASSNSELPSSKREQELLTLIYDLNECNDVLLSKVSTLEAALKASQQSVHPGMEGTKAIQKELVEQLSAQQVIAQQTAQTAQQQIDKLIEQLETAEQTLRRRQLIQETLQAELDDAKARINQLECECALVAQQHADEAQARIKADTTNRDLRSRLQRQQRYTLQFKTALEKSLSVNVYPTISNSAASDAVFFDKQDKILSVAMPKAERIVPWATVNGASFTDIDPHLESLIRGQTESENFTDSSIAEVSHSELSDLSTDLETELARSLSAVVADNTKVPVLDTEAEKTVWQDIEQVIGVLAKATDNETDNEVSDMPAIRAEAVSTRERAESIDAEPLLNWQTENALPIDPTVSTTSTTQPSLTVNLSDADDTRAIDTSINSKQAQTKQEPTQPAQAAPAQVKAQSTEYLRFIDSKSTVISPLVNPLRTQRKIDSLAAVQLPTFKKIEMG